MLKRYVNSLPHVPDFIFVSLNNMCFAFKFERKKSTEDALY